MRASFSWLGYVLIVSAVVSGFPGCASQPVNCTYPDVVVLPPAIAYPEDGATGVPDNFGTVLYYPSGADLNLRLKAGTSIIATTPGTVPSALPSPLATPPYGGTATPTGARSVPTLSAQTTYQIQYFYSTVSGCPMMTTSGYATLGTFTTQ